MTPADPMLESLRDAHRALDETTERVVREVTNLAASLKVLESVDPTGVDECFEATGEALEDLADFLDAVDRAVAPDSSPDPTDLRELIGELEPAPGPEVVRPDRGRSEGAQTEPGGDGETDGNPGDPFGDISPLRRFSAPYSVLLNLERDLYAERLRRPFRVRKLKEIWGDLNRVGSAHPTDGLVARLGRLETYLGTDRGDSSTGVPWSESDRGEVRSLADRAREIGDWDRETLRRRERDVWVDRVENWVETAEGEEGSAAQMEEMLTRFLTDLPARRTPDVRMLLERLLELDDLPAALRRKTERALDDP